METKSFSLAPSSNPAGCHFSFTSFDKAFPINQGEESLFKKADLLKSQFLDLPCTTLHQGKCYQTCAFFYSFFVNFASCADCVFPEGETKTKLGANRRRSRSNTCWRSSHVTCARTHMHGRRCAYNSTEIYPT